MKLQGTYRARRDDQTYTYEVTWVPGTQFAHWDAKVRLERQLIAIPSGQVPNAGGDLTDAVRREVEYAIEHRLYAD